MLPFLNYTFLLRMILALMRKKSCKNLVRRERGHFEVIHSLNRLKVNLKATIVKLDGPLTDQLLILYFFWGKNLDKVRLP